MNNTRRKQLSKAEKMLDEARAIIEDCRDEEQDYFDNIPENMQDGERAQISEAAIECMDTAIDSLEEVIDNVMNAQE